MPVTLASQILVNHLQWLSMLLFSLILTNLPLLPDRILMVSRLESISLIYFWKTGHSVVGREQRAFCSICSIRAVRVLIIYDFVKGG